MAAKKSAKKSAKKTASSVQKSAPAKRSKKGIILGSAEHDAATQSSSFLKLDNQSGPNMFVLGGAGYYAMAQHYLRGEEKKEMVLCGCHRPDANEVEIARRVMKGFAPDKCPICATVMELYREAKVDPEDPINIAKKALASDIRANVQILFVAAQIEYELTRDRKSGSSIITPFVPDNLKWGLLTMTEAAFRKFTNQFNADGLEGEDLEGCPVNMERGREDGKRYSEVTQVTFYPKQRIELPAELPDFDNLPEFDETALEEMDQKIESEMEQLIQMQMQSGKKTAAKKKAAKKSRKK